MLANISTDTCPGRVINLFRYLTNKLAATHVDSLVCKFYKIKWNNNN